MIYFRLGLINAWRNRSRSAAAIFSMAVAVGFLSYALSLSRGYASTRYQAARLVFGGDISVYTETFAAFAAQDETRYSLRELSESPLTDLARFHGDILQPGYLSSQPVRSAFSDSFIEDVRRQPQVRAVQPHYQLPVWQMLSPISQRTAVLRGRDLLAEAAELQGRQELLCEGRWFEPADAMRGRTDSTQAEPFAAIVSAAIDDPWFEGNPPRPGDIWTLQLPRFRGLDRQGTALFDYLDTVDVQVEIVGVIEATSRSLHWRSVNEGGETSGTEEVEYLSWQFDDIFLPQQSFLELWRRISGGDEYPLQQLHLWLEDISYLEDHLKALQQRYPEASFVSGIGQIENAMASLRLETKPRRAPASSYSLIESADSQPQQIDLRLPLSATIMLIAALIVAAHLLIMVRSRALEIAVLKTLGSGRRHIVRMVMAEALLIANLGALIGVVLVRGQALLNQLVGPQMLSQQLAIFVRFGVDMLISLALSSLMACLFALLPALLMADLPVWEVLKRE